ncbi:hypothetical protein KKF17_03090, partial [Patescibacteria group bacterium]|nr:hypothetical protein [Patescibacteria group bacterium]
MKKVFTGLLEKAPEEKKTNWKDLADINNPNASPTKEGVAGARERFKGIGKSDFTVRGDYNILAELTICPDPTKAGPTNCVITSNFSTAIGEKKTVAEAIDAGDLNPNAVFGFSAAGSEPAYLEGYPYRSMIILRKFRILPVGWELAAQYIKDAVATTDNALATDKTLGDMVACFDEYDDHTGFYAHWCKGLVDPNWVLKAPLNYCKRSGPGPEILSETIMGEQNDSQLAISRNDAYCADEQSCIKESSDGTCHLYGYCTEERRMWNFNTKSCEPKYNTCRTFKGEQDQVVSYLENTLNYGECSIDNIGCQAYCADYATSTQKFTCTYNSGNKIHLDKDVEACEQANEGCHEFIRPKAGLGVNLLINSSFEQGRDSWIFNPSENGATTTIDTNEVYKNKQSLKIYAPNSVSYTNVQQYIYGIVSDELITVSYYVKTELINGPHKGAWLVVYARNNNFFLNDPSTGNHWIEKSVLTEDHQGIGEWERVSFSFVTPPQTNNLIIEPRIQAATGTAYFDAIKVESGEDATEYSDYGNKKDLIYQKYAPTYLGCDKENAPSECDKYVINCKEDEVGCELYTSVKDEIKIPAQVKVKDYCPAGCVGYNIYFQGQTTFDFLRDNYFIPTTAKTCSAEAVGCDEFTNLDELKKGGEAKEYYSYLRQCIRPDKDQCVEFYSWEGSGETGYQLKVVNLQKETVNGPNNNGPKVTEDDSAICNKEIYKLPSYDPMYQPNCRQFYNRAGAEFYHLVNNTISCSDNCHPYRRTAVSDDPTIVSETACASTSGSVDKYWDKDNEQCLVCKNNGVWNNQQSACIYMAIPGQGAVCSAEQNNCREYIGNTGDNVEFVFNYDFEGSMEDWIGIGGATAAVSNEAPITGGKSLFISGDNSHKVGVIVGDAVRLDAAYVLSFVAKKDIAGSDKIITVTLTDGAYTSTFAVAKLYNDTEWHSYKINLDSLGHKPVKDIEKLIMQANSNFYLDNIRLTEVVENYYLIKNSWATPSVCNEDHDNKPSPLYMLGCEAYYDRDDKTHNLLSFSSLCAESVVGCELMIDTQNSSDYKQETFNASDATSTIRVPADSVKYIIYDKNRQCNADDKGCQRLGKPYQYDQSLLYSDVYLKNNPNKYNEILCSSGATDCKEWSSGDGLTYFKDPGNMLCEWRQKANSGTGGWGWYKKKIKRCDDGNRSICLTDKDCISPGTCKLETEDNACSVSSLKTFGTGGVRVEQPKDNWVGLCEASSVGCSEYIDPISRFNTNLLSGSNSSQKISLKQNTLYLLARQKDTGSITINCSEDVYVLGNDNKLSLNKANNVIIVQDISDTRSSELFYISDNDVPCTCTISGNKIELKKVELKKAIVDYQLKENLSEGDCGGMVGFERNCILFNERTQSGKNLVALKYDADKTYIDGPKGASPSET